MAPAPKTQADRIAKGRLSRRREIAGILLLAFGLFASLSLLSSQIGDGRLMGPGGAAAASGLYALAGFGAYLLVAGALVAAVRCFRGRRVIDGMAEALGVPMLFGAVTVLLHLPFADSPTAQHGPGGLAGQWLGEVAASFVGAAGAALGATTALVVALLMLTEISTREVWVVL